MRRIPQILLVVVFLVIWLAAAITLMVCGAAVGP